MVVDGGRYDQRTTYRIRYHRNRRRNSMLPDRIGLMINPRDVAPVSRTSRSLASTVEQRTGLRCAGIKPTGTYPRWSSYPLGVYRATNGEDNRQMHKRPTAGEQRLALYERYAPELPPMGSLLRLDYPNAQESCYDCGSTIAHRHTPLCAMADKGDDITLPAKPNTQWWTGEVA